MINIEQVKPQPKVTADQVRMIREITACSVFEAKAIANHINNVGPLTMSEINAKSYTTINESKSRGLICQLIDRVSVLETQVKQLQERVRDK